MRSGGRDFSRLPDVLEVTDETARKPTSNPLSVSPYLPVLRVNRPEAVVRYRTPRAGAARVLRALGRQETWGCRTLDLIVDGMGWRMKPCVNQSQKHSPCLPVLTM